MAKKLPPELREYLSKIGPKGGLKGGKARAARVTPEQRSASARKAVEARWARKLGQSMILTEEGRREILRAPALSEAISRSGRKRRPAS
jgi:hypothetical protein